MHAVQAHSIEQLQRTATNQIPAYGSELSKGGILIGCCRFLTAHP